MQGQPIEASAHLYDGLSARRHEVTLRLDRDRGALEITGETLAAPLLWPLPDLRALDGHADTEQMVLTRHEEVEDVTPRDPARLIIHDPEMIDWLHRSRPRLYRRDLRKGTMRKLALRLGGAVGAVALMLFVILPAMAGTLARVLPVEREVAFGRAVKAQMEQMLGGDDTGSLICDAPAGRAALDSMVTRLLGDMDIGYDLDVAVFDHDMMNAFAAPGGQLVIIRGLLDKAETPEMVAAVLAHEIGHVAHRDPTRNALRTAGSVGLLGLLFGDFTGGAVVIALTERILINARYSQKAETEADAFAHDMLRNAALPPAALADMFEIFRNEAGDVEGPMAHFLSHPRLADRIDAARAAPTAQGSSDPVLNASDWEALQHICDPA